MPGAFLRSFWETGRLGLLLVLLLTPLVRPPAAVAAEGPGTVYLVLGSDADTWNFGLTPGTYGTTVDTHLPHPYYPTGLFTDPNGPAYQVMEPAFRNRFQDSFGQGLKFTWWMMGGNIFRNGLNANVPLPNTINVYLMKKYHGASLQQFGDELTLHYHTFIWSDYDQDGISHWNQSPTFEECRDDFELTVAQYLLEEEVFAASFRSGWHFMDNTWQQRLNELIPFCMHDNFGAYKAWAFPEPVGNVEDWRKAPSAFVPFHPSTTNYQAAGDGQGWNVRSVKMQNLTQATVNQIFTAASNGVDQVACFWDHLPENFVTNVNRIGPMIQLASSNSPAVPFRFCTAVEAMQRWLGVWGLPPTSLEVAEEVQGDTVTLHITTGGPIFQPQPYVALKDIHAQYPVLTCSNTGPNTWDVPLPGPRDYLAKVGVAITDEAGNVATRLLRYLPDDLFLETADPSYQEVSGNWTSTTNTAWGTNARIAQVAGQDVAIARWMLPLTWSGRYELYTQVPAITNAATNVLVEVISGGTTVLSVGSSQPPPARQWLYLGSVFLDATLSNSVVLTVSGATQPGSYAVANVIKLSPLRLAQPGFISDMAVDPFDTSANITWSTLGPATTLVEYGPTPGYGWSTPTNMAPVIRHVMTLTGLKPGTTNYFQIESVQNGVIYAYQGSFITADFSGTGVVLPIFDLTNVWKFTTNNLDGVPWKAPDHDDSGWPEGPGLLWVDTRPNGPNPSVPFRNTQMPDNPVTHFPYITYYFRSHFAFTNGVPGTVLVFSNYIDDGAIFYLNGVEIKRVNLAAAPSVITNATLANAYNCGGDATCAVVFSVSGNLVTNLAQGDNVLAVEVHNYAAASPDITFGSALMFNQPIIPPPRLHCLISGPYLTLYWNGTGFTLQQASDLNLNSAGWADVPGPVARSPYSLTNANPGTLFYRLRH